METDELSSCPVCFEPYKEVGGGIPRIFPCHCTLCHRCIGKLLKANTVLCPQDRQAHAAINGITSFPQNKYILIYLKNKGKDIKMEKHFCKSTKRMRHCFAEQRNVEDRFVEHVNTNGTMFSILLMKSRKTKRHCWLKLRIR